MCVCGADGVSVARLITEFTPISKDLVDAFAVPDFLLGAIGHDYTKYYTYENAKTASHSSGKVCD